MDISVSRMILTKFSQHLLVLVAVACLVLVSTPHSQGNTNSLLVPLNEHNRATKLITHFLDKYHYKTFRINNTLSDKILGSYIELLDPNRSYFYKKDIESFQIFRFELDEALNNSELSAPFQMFRLYQARVEERVLFALELLDRKFDFTLDEQLTIDRSDLSWPTNKTELNEIWRKRVKNDVLTLKLADKNSAEIKDTLENAIKPYLNAANKLMPKTFINYL